MNAADALTSGGSLIAVLILIRFWIALEQHWSRNDR